MHIPFEHQDNCQNKALSDTKSSFYNEHSVIIYFNYGKVDDEPFYNLSLKFYSLFEDSPLGIYDGHEIAMDNSDGSYYFYGPNAENIFKFILPILEGFDFMKGATAVLRFGPLNKDSPEIEVEINAS